jgi:hypothetical protein
MAIGTIPFVFDKYNNSFANDLATGREAPPFSQPKIYFPTKKYIYYKREMSGILIYEYLFCFGFLPFLLQKIYFIYEI